MEWLRWYHGTVKDPKWRVIAKNAGTSIPNVIAIWAALLENASESEKRGVLSGWNPEDVAACFDVTVETVVTVCNAMQQKVLLHETLTGWEKRNPKRERTDNSTDRVRRFREKKRQVTPSNARKRLDKSREEKKNTGEEGSPLQHSSNIQNTSVNQHGRQTARKSRAPAELAITPTMRLWAQENGITVDLDAETAAMLDHHRGKGNLHDDWEATWRTWMRNTKKFGSKNGNSNGHQPKEHYQDRVARENRETAARINQQLFAADGDSDGAEDSRRSDRALLPRIK
jgi:hypothetical protein